MSSSPAMRYITILAFLVLAVACFGLQGDPSSPQFSTVGADSNGTVLVPTNQLLQPAGDRIQMPGRPLDLALSPGGDLVAIRLPNALRLYSSSGAFVRSIGLSAASFLGLTFMPGGDWG